MKQTKRVKEEDVFPLVLLAKAGDKQAYNRLFEILALLIRKTVRARNYFPTNQIEDIIQGVIADMVRGYRNYNVDRGTPFLMFAQLCIKRSITQAWRTFSCPTNQIHFRADSLDAQLFEDNKKKDGYAWLRYHDPGFDQVASICNNTDPEDFTAPGTTEYWVLIDYLKHPGDSYAERAERVSKMKGKTVKGKGVDNARLRIQMGHKQKKNLRDFILWYQAIDY